MTTELPAEAAAGVRFPVEGMTCASCVNRIERYLRKVDGVAEANVNLATEHAAVRFNPAQVSLDDLRSAVEAAGYEALIERAEMSGAAGTIGVEIGRAGAGRAGAGRAGAGRAGAGDGPAVEANPAAAHRQVAGEPETSYQQRHLGDTRKRLMVATVLTIPLLLGLASMTIAPFLPSILMNPWLQLTLATPVQFYAGWPFYKGAWKVLRHGATDMNTLIAVGTSAAYFYSLAAILFPGFFRAAGVATEGQLPLYFDTAAAIVALILLGRFLEARARPLPVRRLAGSPQCRRPGRRAGSASQSPVSTRGR